MSRRILCLLICCWMLVIVITRPAYAYYQSEEKTESLFFHKERGYALWGKGEKDFALYDNFNHFSGKDSHEPLIYPRSDNFVPADLISCNLSLRIATLRPMAIENILANFLYANLKLQKQIEEYEALRQRARTLLADLKASYIESDLIVPDETNKKHSIFREKKELELEYELTSRYAWLSVESTESPDQLALVRTESLTSFLSQKKSIASKEKDISSSSEAQVKTKHFVSDTTPTHQKIEASQSNLSINRKREPVNYEKVSLPWGLQLFLDIGDYFFSHKLEVLIFILFLMFVVNILVTMRSQ